MCICVLEMEEVRKKKIKWICQNCSAEKGITSYSIYDSSLNDLLYPKKGMVDQTRMTVLRDDGDVELMAHVPQTAPKERSAHGGEGPTHEKESSTLRPKIEETFFDPGQPVGITTESDMGVGRDEMDFFGATGRITSLASPVPRTSSSLPETAAVGQTTKQPKHDHDKITNRLKALEQSVVQGVEEMKQLVHSSCTTLKQEMKSLFIKALEDFQSRSINNLIQNYGLIDVHVGRLVQLITTHGSDLKREVSQMKMSLTQENIGLSEQLATTPTRDALNSTGVTIDGKSQ
ncbi:hypothetical protein Sjap_018390 [Stephania japonica]|uniref:Uncharacterized protein n=1 Tax=Stephania japonica TaxID=461633 RepID=A0AAP0I7Y9_9MAGN